MTVPPPMRLAAVAVLLATALALVPDALAQAQSPRKRSSFPAGIQVRDTPAGRVDAAGPGGTGGWHGGGPSGGVPAAARLDGGGGAGVRIDGSSAVSGAGSNVNTTSQGSGNYGCTAIGSVAGKGC